MTAYAHCKPGSLSMEDLLAVHLTELGLHFERQYVYAPGRRFRADFAVWGPGMQAFALIEVQGGTFTRGAHGSVTGILKDNARLYAAFRAGWHVLRFTPQQVETGEAKRMIEEAL